MTHPTTECPKCGRILLALGEVMFHNELMPLYGCPECITRRRVKGTVVELPLTFLITPQGHPLDPANPNGEVDCTQYKWLDDEARWDVQP
jgi:hypothetical protein